MVKNSLQYFIGYNDDVIRPLCLKLPQMIGYIKHFEGGNKTMSFNASDSKLLKAHRQISEKWCFAKYCSCDQACQF